MDFRSAKNRPKICILGLDGRQEAIFGAGRWVGRGPSEGQESAEVRVKVRHALAPRSARRGRRMTESALNSFSKRTDVAKQSVYVKSLSFGSFLWSAGLGTVGI